MHPVTQATVFCGRTEGLDVVLDSLLALTYPNLSRLWLVNGPKRLDEFAPRPERLPPSIHVGARVYGPVPKSARLTERLARKHAVAEAWGDMLTRAAALDTDVLFVEDDIVVSPDTTERLQAAAYKHNAIAASGITSTNGQWPVFSLTDDIMRRVPTGSLRGVVPVDIIGTFCLYLRREIFALMAEHKYKPEVKLYIARVNAIGKDIHFCRWLRDHKQRIVADMTVKCRHLYQEPA